MRLITPASFDSILSQLDSLGQSKLSLGQATEHCGISYAFKVGMNCRGEILSVSYLSFQLMTSLGCCFMFSQTDSRNTNAVNEGLLFTDIPTSSQVQVLSRKIYIPRRLKIDTTATTTTDPLRKSHSFCFSMQMLSTNNNTLLAYKLMLLQILPHTSSPHLQTAQV